MHRTVFGQQLEKLVEEIFVVVVHHKLELGLVLERPSRHLARNGPERLLAQVSIEPFRILYLVKVGG